MAEDTVKIDLKQDVRAEDGTLYRAGRGREVPRSVAKGLTAAVGGPAAPAGGEGGTEGGAGGPSGIDATDSARELAEEEGIDLADVEGTGADGRIVKSDVEAAIQAREDEASE